MGSYIKAPCPKGERKQAFFQAVAEVALLCGGALSRLYTDQRCSR